MKKIESLTAEQKIAHDEWFAECMRIGTCTDPADRKKAESAITKMYQFIGKPVPLFVWCDSLYMAQMNLDSNLPYVINEVEEGIENRMATAVSEFESYVAFSLQAKGLEHLASQAPRLTAPEQQQQALPESVELSPEAKKEYDEGEF